MKNCMKMSLPCIEENKNVVIAAVTAFVQLLNPTTQELDDIKTAVREAIDNCIDFAYPEGEGKINIYCKILKDNVLNIIVKDNGVGIEDVEKVKSPLYTTCPSRSGLGITVMESFMDTKVSSTPGKGTTVNLKKRIVQYRVR